jgi:hypothetical protein
VGTGSVSENHLELPANEIQAMRIDKAHSISDRFATVATMQAGRLKIGELFVLSGALRLPVQEIPSIFPSCGSETPLVCGFIRAAR